MFSNMLSIFMVRGYNPNTFAKYYHSAQNPDHAKTGVTVGTKYAK